MSKHTPVCLSPGCSKASSTMNLCDEHYKENEELVGTGLVSWKEIFLIMGMEAAKLHQAQGISTVGPYTTQR